MISFQISKQEGLKVLQEIASHLTNEGDVCLSKNLDKAPERYIRSKSNIVPYRHSLAVIEVTLEEYSGEPLNAIPDDVIQREIDEGNYIRSNTIDILFGTLSAGEIPGELPFVSYLRETSMACDTSYLTLEYNETLKMFYLSEDGEAGVNGEVIFLDFSE